MYKILTNKKVQFCISVEQVNLHDALVWLDANREKSDSTIHFFSWRRLDYWFLLRELQNIFPYLIYVISFCCMCCWQQPRIICVFRIIPQYVLVRLNLSTLARIWWILVSTLIFCRSVFSWELGIRLSFLLYDRTNKGKSISKPFQLIMRFYRKFWGFSNV